MSDYTNQHPPVHYGNAYSVAKHAAEAEGMVTRVKQIGENSAQLRALIRANPVAARMTMRALAREMDISSTHLGNMETGVRPFSQPVALLAIDAVRRYKNRNWI